MLKGIGFDDHALSLPQVMVSHAWIETMPCNYNQRDLAAAVKEGVRAAGGTPQEVNTIAISDGVTMGTDTIEVKSRPRSDWIGRYRGSASLSWVMTTGSRWLATQPETPDPKGS